MLLTILNKELQSRAEYSVRNFYRKDYLHVKAMNIEILRILLMENKYLVPIRIESNKYLYIINEKHDL